MISLDSIKSFLQHISGGLPWKGVVARELDLTAFEDKMLHLDLKDSFFLGCRLTPALMVRLHQTGGFYFPELRDLPFHPYRGSLYQRDNLFDGFDPGNHNSYQGTSDYRIYQFFLRTQDGINASPLNTLAQRLHDYSITEAVEKFLEPWGDKRRLIAVMGGHGMKRGGEDFRQVSYLSRSLARKGFLMISGGGPGAMEATHLGVWFTHYSDAELEEAMAILAEAPVYKDPWWLSRAFDVIKKFPPRSGASGFPESLGIPTWLYGHEPPTPFASHIAKYFANSVREEGLLALAKGGVIYSPGNHGTVQEIFQDACQNRYKTYEIASPMVFLNRQYWETETPAYPLLVKMAEDHDYRKLISIVDDPEEAVAFLEGR